MKSIRNIVIAVIFISCSVCYAWGEKQVHSDMLIFGLPMAVINQPF